MDQLLQLSVLQTHKLLLLWEYKYKYSLKFCRKNLFVVLSNFGLPGSCRCQQLLYCFLAVTTIVKVWCEVQHMSSIILSLSAAYMLCMSLTREH